MELPPVRNVPEEQIFSVVRAEIARAYADTRFAVPSDAEQQRMVEETVQGIKKYASTIRIEEIPEAIRDGVMGVHGEFPGLSVATFVKFCVYHVNSQKRRDRMKALTREKNEPAPPTPEELDRRWMEHLKKAFDTVKYGEIYEDHGNKLYEWLDEEKGKIQFTKERKLHFMDQARLQLAAEKEAERASSDFFKRRHLASIIETIRSDHHPPIVVVRAKKIALNAFIQDQLEFGLTAESLFENEGQE